jgi:DnaJ family protein A protein 2
MVKERKFYDLLEADVNASEADLKKAYRKKCVFTGSKLAIRD